MIDNIAVTSLLKEKLGIGLDYINQINGYSNANYRVGINGEDFILKLYPFSTQLMQELIAETELLLHINANFECQCPRPLALEENNYLVRCVQNHKETIVRILSYLPGQLLGEQSVYEQSTINQIGKLLGRLHVGLEDFDQPYLRLRSISWDTENLQINAHLLDYISDPRQKKIVRYFFQQLAIQYFPLLPKLRKSYIHNDVNEWNILKQRDETYTLIDYCDAVYSILIHDIANAAVYLSYSQEGWIENIETLLASYHNVNPLEDTEIENLYYAMVGRLIISVCHSAKAREDDPQNTYATISEENAWRMLERLLVTSSITLSKRLKNAISENQEQTSPPEIKALLKKRSHLMARNLSVSYDNPIYLSHSAFQYMYDQDGSTYLDAYNNIPHVGHCHPNVVEAAYRQMATLNTNTRYLFDSIYQYSERLLNYFEDDLNKLYLVNSGSAASDLALRIMHEAGIPRGTIVVMEYGYHGNTHSDIDISHYKFGSAKGRGQALNIKVAKIPDQYRYPDKSGEVWADELIQELEEVPGAILGFIAEPIIGCGGQVPLPQGYLNTIYPYIRSRGGLCVSDEVQTGFGRLGHEFWGYQLYGVIPDMVVLGKPMGNGHPIGGLVVTEAVTEKFEKGVEFFSSFGGNPVSCEVGMAVLDVIEDEALQANARDVGGYYKASMTRLKDRYECKGDVRGSGLFLGLELVHPGGFEPHTKLAHELKNELRNRYILVSTDGPADNVIKTKPPLCFSKENVDRVIAEIDKILSKKNT